MPTPNPNETQSKFISRCVPIVMQEAGTKDREHAVAKCYGIWQQSKKEKSK